MAIAQVKLHGFIEIEKGVLMHPCQEAKNEFLRATKEWGDFGKTEQEVYKLSSMEQLDPKKKSVEINHEKSKPQPIMKEEAENRFIKAMSDYLDCIKKHGLPKEE